jgi:hypothetical protein
MIEMKSIEINGRNLQYDSGYGSDIAGDWEATHFYEGTEKVKRRRWVGFFKWETYEVEEPKLLFTIDANINSTRLSKSWWRKMIKHELSLVDRKGEIERGELI